MSEVDERVVEMRFNNQQFESGIKTSLDSLDRLKEGLNLSGSAKSLTELENAANRFSLENLGRSVDTIANRFGALEIVAITTLQNITNSAISTAKKIADAFIINPKKTGFQEYETQINAVQTILANTSSKGTTLDQVNEALDELNHYADMTIYNFTEMTRNIGTFTAAGVDLDTAVSAIKGIANLAAVSGSTSTQAATAMYQLSQALAAGTVKLMDWNSVVNAGMGGEVFQNALKDTARVHGIAIDEMIAKEGSFRETLSSGWLSAEILTETLSKFTGDLSKSQLQQMGYTEQQIDSILEMGQTANDAATKVKTFTQLWDTLAEAAQSGWTQTWEIIVGDFEEAKTLLTSISDVFSELINNSANARNSLLEGAFGDKTVNLDDWNLLASSNVEGTALLREALIETARTHGIAIDEMIEEQGSFRDTLSEGWVSANILADTLDRLTNEQADNANFTEEQAEALQKLISSAEDVNAPMNELLNSFYRPTGRELLIESVSNAFKGLSTILGSIKSAWDTVFPKTTSEQLYSLLENVNKLSEHFLISEESAFKLRITFTGLFSVLNIGVQAVKAVASIFGQLISLLPSTNGSILDVTASIGTMALQFSNAVEQSGIFREAARVVVEAIKTIGSAISLGISLIKEFLSSLGFKFDTSELESVREHLANVADALSEFRSKAENTFEKFKMGAEDAFGSIGEKISSFGTLLTNVKNTLAGFAAKVGEFFAPIAESIKNAFAGVNVTDVVGTGLLAGIVVLVKQVLDQINRVTKSFGDVMNSAVKVLNSARDALKAWQNEIKAKTLLEIAAAVGVLAVSLIALTRLDGAKLASGLGAVSALLVEVIGSLAVLDNLGVDDSGVAKAATAMILLSVSVSILAGALAKLSGFESWEEALTATSALILLIAALTKTIKTMPSDLNGTEFIKTAAGLVIFAAAIKKLANAMASFAELSVGEIIKSLTTMGVLFAEIGAFLKLSDIKELQSGRTVLVQLASSMLLLYVAISKFGEMDTGVLAQGLQTAGLLMIGLAASVRLMGSAQLSGVATSLIAMAAAMNLLIIPIKVFGSMDISTLTQGMLGFGAALVTMGTVLAALGSIGGNYASAGAGLLLMATAMTMIAIPIAALGAMNVENLAIGLGTLLVALAGMAAVAAVLTPFAATLLTVAGAMTLMGVSVLAVSAGVLALSVAFTTLAGLGAAGALAIAAALSTIITGVAALVPAIASTLATGLVSFLTTISTMASPLCAAVGAILTALFDLITDMAPRFVEMVATILTEALSTIASHAEQFVSAGLQLLIGILNAIAANIGEVIESAVNVVLAFVAGIAQEIPVVVQAAFDLIIQFIDALGVGIEENTPRLVESLIGLGGHLITGLVNGLLAGVSTVIDTVKEIGTNIINTFKNVLDIHSPSGKGEEIGEDTDAGVAQGLTNGSSLIEKAAEFVAGKTVTSFTDKFKTGETTITDTVSDGDKEIASTISNSNKSTKAAGAKAESIADAFTEALDKIDLDEETADLELSFWQSSFKQTADQTEYITKELDNLTAKIEYQTQRVQIAEQKYQKSLNTLGASSTDTQKAYNELLQEKIDLLSMQTEEWASGISDTFSTLTDRIDLLDNVNEAYQGFIESFYGDKMDSAESGAFAYISALESYNSALETYTLAQEKYNTIVQQLGPDAEESKNALIDLYSEAGELIELYDALQEAAYRGKGLEDWNEESARMLYDSMLRQAEDKIEAITGASITAGDAISSAMSDSIDSEAISSSIATGIGDGLITAVNEQSPQIADAAQSALDSLSSGMASGVYDSSRSTVDSFSTIIQDSLNKANSYQSEFVLVGKNFVLGISSGIIDNKDLAINASSEIAQGIYDAAADGLEIHSPSALGENLGKYWDQGIARGMKNYVGLVDDSAGSISDYVIGSMQDTISRLADLTMDGFDTSPTITPVLDLSEITAGANAIEGIVGRVPVAASGIGSYGFGTQEIKMDSSDIVNAISDLNDRMEEMNNMISRLQIVMDTGALVGELEDPLDKRMAQRATKAARGR